MIWYTDPALSLIRCTTVNYEPHIGADKIKVIGRSCREPQTPSSGVPPLTGSGGHHVLQCDSHEATFWSRSWRTTRNCKGIPFGLESEAIVRGLKLARRHLKLLRAGYGVLPALKWRLVRCAEGDMVGWTTENRSAAGLVLGVHCYPRSRRSSFRSTAYMRL